MPAFRRAVEQGYGIELDVQLTADGKAGVYQHGAVRSDIATIEVTYLDPKTLPDTEVPETDYVLLSDEDFDENQSSK